MGVIRKIAALAAAVALTACAGTGFSWDAARAIKPGMTAAEVQQIMGRPYMTSARADGDVWIWSHANGLTGASRSASVTFKDGVVVSVPRIPGGY